MCYFCFKDKAVRLSHTQKIIILKSYLLIRQGLTTMHTAKHQHGTPQHLKTANDQLVSFRSVGQANVAAELETSFHDELDRQL